MNQSNVPRSLRGVFFDMGGTLFHHQSAASARVNFETVATEMGIPPRKELYESFAQHRMETERTFATRSFFLHRELVAEAFRSFARSFGVAVPESAIARYCDLQRQSVVDELSVRMDCIDTLRALRDQGKFLSIVSNIDEDYFQPLLEKHGLREYFDDCVSSELAASCKPHHRIFELALERSGLAACEALFIGDSLENDVRGAHAVGMRTVLFDEYSANPAHEEPDFVVGSLYELVTRVLPEIDAPMR